MKKSFFILSVSTFFFSSYSMAINHQACSRMLNNGLYKKYEYGGIDQPLTKATKKHGTSKGVSATTTEGTTAVLDPKYWSNVSSSGTQLTSSTGECRLFGINLLKEQREMYFLQNRDEIIAQISQGGGPHVDVIAAYSLCDDSRISDFSKELQRKTGSFIQTERDFGIILNTAILDAKLDQACLIF
ncbi:MAG: DUF3015 family protein [Bacteriovoracaceae bacterium]